jgi:hypothetical protein
MEERAAGKTPSFTPTNKNNQENKDKRFLFTFEESQESHKEDYKEDESEPIIVSHDFNEDESQLWKSEKQVV